MDKKNYITPMVEIHEFDAESIIVVSGTGNTGGGFYGEWDTDIPEID